MAGKTQNIKALFSNTKTRVIIIFTALMVIVAVSVGYVKLSKTLAGDGSADADLSTTPNIQSIPGALNPTEQYASLQASQNVAQAQQAAKTGGSAIPTIIKTQAFGEGIQSVGPQGGTGGLGFVALSQQQGGGTAKSLWLQELKNSNCSKQTVQKVIRQGAVINDLKEVCSCTQLKDVGYTLNELQGVCSCKKLKAAGYNARQLKDVGFSAGQLRLCGFDACQLKNAGFTAEQMKAGGFSDGELKGAGFSPDEINKAGGLPNGITAADVRKAGCSPSALRKLREAGVTAAAIRRISGCSASQLKAAGYTAKELRDAGFTAAELKKAGFNAAQLKAAGFSARDLLNAGFTPEQLKEAGFTDAQIKQADEQLPPGITPEDVKKAGCDVDTLKKERLAGVSALAIKKYAGCSAAALKAAGFTDDDLRRAGFTPEQIKQADLGLPPGITPSDLKKVNCNDTAAVKKLREKGVSAKALKTYAGCDAAQLKAAGFSNDDLRAAGFTPQQIAAADASLPPGITPADIKNAGCSVDAIKRLKAKGVSAAQIHKYAGCSAAQLKAAGFTAKELKAAGFTAKQLKDAGFSAAELKDAGFTAGQLKNAGFTAAQLKNAGFTDGQLRAAGFSPQQIADADSEAQKLANLGYNLPAGVSVADIKKAGCNPSALARLREKGVTANAIRKINGCSAAALKAAGYSASDLKDAGFTPEQLLNAGFTPDELKKAGFSPAAILAAGRVTDCSIKSLRAARAEGISAADIRKTLGCSAKQLKAAGYTAKELKDAGFTAAQLKDAGFTAAQLKAAGFSAKQLKDAGFSAKELKDAGFSAAQLKAAGFTAKQLKDAGFSAQQLKDAGFTAKQLKDAGFSAAQLKAAGFSAQQLKDAGFSAQQLKDAGFSAKQLKDAGFNAQQLKDAGFNTNQLKDAGFSNAELKAAGFDIAGLGAPSLPGVDQSSLTTVPGKQTKSSDGAKAQAEKLQSILNRQNKQMAEQKYQQQILQKQSKLTSKANQFLNDWKQVSTQYYTAGGNPDYGLGESDKATEGSAAKGTAGSSSAAATSAQSKPPLIKTGDVLFAVLDSSVNSDEPSPILASIVAGKLKGTKLIGSFTLPSNANKMVITFTKMSIPGVDKTVTINAYAIDPNTARTALASRTNHHYLMRYGSLFASSFLEGFGNAFQSANTTVTIGGTGGTNDVTVQNGIGRSAMENAVIALADVGKAWGQQVQTYMNRPTTVEVFSGTGLGILFTQDVAAVD